MSNLMIALAAAGGVVLAGVVAHGAWQARRAGPKRPDPLPRAPVDGAISAGPVEPQFGPSDAEPGANLPADEDSAVLPGLRLPRRALPRIDALIDGIASVALDAPLPAELLLPHLPPSRRAGSKLMLVEGLNADSGEWEPVAAGQRYSELQAAVQLAHRGGPLNDIEFSEFVQKVQAMAEGIGSAAAFPELPDMLETVARARELDAFAATHDAQLAVHLQARAAAWSVGYLQQHAARHGFVPGALPGRLVLPGAEDGSPPVLTLSFDAQAALADDPNQSALRDVTLAFDVPQTDPGAEPFTAWQASAQALSLGMDAAIVDDNGQPLSPPGFDVIGAELQRLYDALAAHELPAGSAAARRLFS